MRVSRDGMSSAKTRSITVCWRAAERKAGRLAESAIGLAQIQGQHHVARQAVAPRQADHQQHDQDQDQQESEFGDAVQNRRHDRAEPAQKGGHGEILSAGRAYIAALRGKTVAEAGMRQNPACREQSRAFPVMLKI